MDEIKEQFNRLRRWRKRLEDIFQHKYTTLNKPENDEDNRDFIYAFFLNCYHLKDWVIQSGLIKKELVYDFVESNKDMKICRDICNGVKHFKVKNPSINPDVSRTLHSSVYSIAFNNAEPEIKPVYWIVPEKHPVDAFGLAVNCFYLWEGFLKRNGVKYI